ncbi:hypothetical protein JWJ90_10770 [Desulfobulbus rhabdoformis]|uniref:hypothetical protein n=1 Tax=Desulfobulbus rhabdoformis TaxID=34032 RepID=UPI001963EF8D|nr:hypothetical protein [Desulfobulbus rhabdoformis]MBM9614766.1 hypothetical protein [Desulfobulbus rhabdoformis]
MNRIELDERLEALIKYLKRQGGQTVVTTGIRWPHLKINDMVEAVQTARKRIMKEAEK